MGWKALVYPADELSAFARRAAKKAQFLVDESLGNGTADLLRQAGWNARFVTDLGLKGRGDDAIFKAAWKENRILLTHDPDFLDDKRFPEYRNPGVVVLPGGDGNERVLLHSLGGMLSLIGPFRELYRKTKVVIGSSGEVEVRSRNFDTGVIERCLYRFPRNRPPEVWVDERSFETSWTILMTHWVRASRLSKLTKGFHKL